MSVLVVGSVALDNVKTPFGEVTDAQGGSCSYASVSASYFAPTAVVGVVGGDYPKSHLNLLRKRGVDTSGLQVVREGKTFRWAGYYEFDMNQAFTTDTQLNVFADFRPQIPPALCDAQFVLLGNIDPELQLEVLERVHRPRLALVDTMNFWITGKPDALLRVLKRCDIALLNEGEARQLCDTPNLQKAAGQLLKLGLKRVIIKKGEHGCLMFAPGEFFSAPGFPLEVVKDPTGAGDTFAGGFIGFLAGARSISENTFRQAVIVGSAMASFTVEDFSLRRLARLASDELARRCAQLRAQTAFPPIKVPVREA